MDKKSFFVFAVVGFFVVLSLLISVSAQTGCCLKPVSGPLCQDVEASDCQEGFHPSSSCVTFDLCRVGTCIDSVGGECSSNSVKYECLSEGKEWSSEQSSELEECSALGCCTYGQNTAWVTKLRCNSIGTTYGIETSFDSSVETESQCVGMAGGSEEGACVFERDPENLPGALMCRRLSKTDCLEKGERYMGFYPGRLCTDPSLPTNCMPSKDVTVCKWDKLYFTDTCGNRANVYDETMMPGDPNVNPNPVVVKNYWTYIISYKDSCDYAESPETCGNCDVLENSICQSYSEASRNEANGANFERPNYGENVCGNIGCWYDTDGDGRVETSEHYESGEKWCAKTPGTPWPPIRIDSIEMKFLDDNASREVLKEYDKYNIPGSEYIELSCWYGVVYPEFCGNFRTGICMEFNGSNGRKSAGCFENKANECMSKENKADCEGSIFCQWIPGYRFDGKELTFKVYRNQEEQGSCVPLFPQGFEFWPAENSDGQDEDLSRNGVYFCSANVSVAEPAVFETSFMNNRDKFEDQSLETAADNCLDNCYAIPMYGYDANRSFPGRSPEEVIQAVLWTSLDMPDKIKTYALSRRKDHYCENPDGLMGGSRVSGHSIGCDSPETSEYMQMALESIFSGAATLGGIKTLLGGSDVRDIPTFLTNREWRESITSRAKFMGDCGYKPGIYADLQGVDKGLETIEVSFLKLDDSGKPKDWKEEWQKIYEGDSYLDGILS